MWQVFNTIVPVFIVILAGSFLTCRGFFPRELISFLNKLVFYVAIPVMIFKEVAGIDLLAHFSLLLVLGTLLPLLLVFPLAWLLGRWTTSSSKDMGTYIQTTIHGNLGYIGLAVCYYFLGQEGFAIAGILAGFLMLFQNIASVLILQFNLEKQGSFENISSIVKMVLGNPVIVSALAGMLFSLSKLPLPTLAERTLSIVSDMVLPLALLVIGASLSFNLIRNYLLPTLSSAFLKLIVLPGMGLCFYRAFGFSPEQYLPGLILLAAPPP